MNVEKTIQLIPQMKKALRFITLQICPLASLSYKSAKFSICCMWFLYSNNYIVEDLLIKSLY